MTCHVHHAERGAESPLADTMKYRPDVVTYAGVVSICLPAVGVMSMMSAIDISSSIIHLMRCLSYHARNDNSAASQVSDE